MVGFAKIPAHQTGVWTLHSLDQRHYMWYTIAPYFPFGLAILAFTGYYYTAIQLNWRCISTLWLALGLLIVNSLIQRWIFLTRRNIAFQELQRKRALQQESESETSVETAPQEMVIEEAELDIKAINEQTRTLIRSFLALGFLLGLGLIWFDMLPALDFLDRVELWEYGEQTVTTAVEEGTGAEVGPVMEKSVVTLKNILIAFLILAMMIISTKNVPGMLEMLVLQKMQMDVGARYAYYDCRSLYYHIRGCDFAVWIVGDPLVVHSVVDCGDDCGAWIRAAGDFREFCLRFDNSL